MVRAYDKQANSTSTLLQEPLLDKLRALDYESHFCTMYAACQHHTASTTPTRHAIPPLSRFHFAFSKPDPSLAFCFLSLVGVLAHCTPTTPTHCIQASWLLAAAGRESDKPLRIDANNPSTTVDALLAEAKSLGLFTPPLERLREHLGQGVGAGATALLNALCDLALERRSFQWQPAQREPAAGGYVSTTCLMPCFT